MNSVTRMGDFCSKVAQIFSDFLAIIKTSLEN